MEYLCFINRLLHRLTRNTHVAHIERVHRKVQMSFDANDHWSIKSARDAAYLGGDFAEIRRTIHVAVAEVTRITFPVEECDVRYKIVQFVVSIASVKSELL